MNRVAFIFKSAPHGSSAGREGLDVLIATSAWSEDIGVFFVGDGVFQILAEQQPSIILARDYIVTFKVLPLCNIKIFRVCNTSLYERGIKKNVSFVLDAKVLTADKLREEITQYQTIFTF